MGFSTKNHRGYLHIRKPPLFHIMIPYYPILWTIMNHSEPLWTIISWKPSKTIPNINFPGPSRIGRRGVSPPHSWTLHLPLVVLLDLASLRRSVPPEQCSKIPLYWLVYRDSPFLDYFNPQYIKGSIIPQLIINQQRFWTLLTWRC